MVPTIMNKYRCDGVGEQLKDWREMWQIADVQSHCASPKSDTYSSTVIATAGCMSLIAQTRAGLLPINGFELHNDDDTRAMHEMCKDLVMIEPMGDFRRVNPKSIRRSKIVSTGLPCPDYSPLGSRKGAKGQKGGDCYVDQGKWLVAYGADICIIEQSANARTLDSGDGSGADFNKLKVALCESYVVYDDDIRCWRYGDVTNRTRLYIVAVHKRHGDKAHEWKWPEYQFDASRFPIGADVCVPDCDVPPEYLLEGAPKEEFQWTEPRPGKIHKVGRYGDRGVGDCEAPFPLYSLLGLPHTQLTSNGGGRFVMLDWQPGQTIVQTRMPTITCTSNMASLPSSYVHWVRQFGDGSDRFVRKCINMGEPLQTCTAIHQQAAKFLEHLGVEHDIFSVEENEQHRVHRTLSSKNKKKHSTQLWKQMYAGVRSLLVDTGASGSLNKRSLEPYLHNASESKVTIQTAKEGAQMSGSMDGTAKILTLNTAGYKGYKEYTPHSYETTTCEGTTTELYSMDDPFRSGRWNLKIRQPDHESGVSEICRDAKHGQPAESIPLRYDYGESGGWWIDYLPVRPEVTERQRKLMAHFLMWQQNRQTENTSRQRVAMLIRHTYDEDSSEVELRRILDLKGDDIVTVKVAKGCDCEAKAMQHEEQGLPPSEYTCTLCTDDEQTLRACKTEHLTDVIEARIPDEKEIRGTKELLKNGRAKWSNQKFHKTMGHSGNCNGCWICRSVKGAMKRYTVKVDPHRETRKWHVIWMDAVTFSHRSVEGNKFMITFRDEGSGMYALRAMYLKSDAPQIIKEFILQMRSDPDFQSKSGRVLIKYIVTDEPGEWGLKSKQWAKVKQDLEIQSRHCTPETSKEMGYSENSNKIAEQTIMSFLMESNLPEDHWEACMRAAEFVLNRFPNLSTDVNESIDGDRASPIEIGTQGRYSRRQVHRELSYFLPPGTIALVHSPKVKGSQLKAKVRYGIAWGMYREQVIFRCPFTASTFRSKSYHAFETKEGLNCYQFLGIESKKTTRRKLQLKNDKMMKVDIQLPKPSEPREMPQLPVIAFQSANDEGVVTSTCDKSEGDEASEGGNMRSKRSEHTEAPVDKSEGDEASEEGELGGSARIFSEAGERIEVDKTKGDFYMYLIYNIYKNMITQLLFTHFTNNCSEKGQAEHTVKQAS